ncbi:Na+/H+ antiporter [Streptomyces sp. 142MFCol3.1]|uniref:Na+/H+ antiporter n=1 Tax=Streptomyces sp. 142MFCol3.1 TaxID=1172179 RepID=UPI0004232399|nr:Na+/H+ antiporter [Streptomyces sp. 142MFCol3.1]
MTDVLLLVVPVTLLAVVVRRAEISAPVSLVLAGLLASFVPGVPDYHLDPHVVLFLFIPPMVYSEACESSFLSFRVNARPIALLSVGLVLFTMALVALVAHSVVPGMSWPVAFVLGAVLGPTDVVAAVSVARRLGLPRRLVRIMTAESLFNDSTGLTAYRITVAIVAGGGFSLLDGVRDFVLACSGGLFLGLFIAWPVRRLQCWLGDAVAHTAVSLLVPFVTYALAEYLHASGVLAVLAAGLYLGHHSNRASHAARIQEQASWKLIVFLLESLVFALIGLQLRPVLGSLDGIAPWTLIWYAAAVSATVMLGRFLWVFPATYLPRWLSPRLRARDPSPPWQLPATLSWAGIRGVVSLAAAFALPDDMPHRELVLFLTFSVTLSTLFVQGLGFPAFVRLLGLAGTNGEHDDHLAEARAQEEAARLAQHRLEELVAHEHRHCPQHVVLRLREVAEYRRVAAWERLRDDGRLGSQSPSAAYRLLRREMLAAEREAFIMMRNQGRLDDEVARQVVHQLDFEEAALSRDLHL